MLFDSGSHAHTYPHAEPAADLPCCVRTVHAHGAVLAGDDRAHVYPELRGSAWCIHVHASRHGL